jgi:hypothetical protein
MIFLLREPEGTIKSIINMGNLIGNQDYKNPKWALNYYRDRLKTIEGYPSIIHYQNGLFLDSEYSRALESQVMEIL